MRSQRVRVDTPPFKSVAPRLSSQLAKDPAMGALKAMDNYKSMRSGNTPHFFCCFRTAGVLHARGTQYRVIAKMAISSQELSPDCNLSSHLAIMATGSGIPAYSLPTATFPF